MVSMISVLPLKSHSGISKMWPGSKCTDKRAIYGNSFSFSSTGLDWTEQPSLMYIDCDVKKLLYSPADGCCTDIRDIYGSSLFPFNVP